MFLSKQLLNFALVFATTSSLAQSPNPNATAPTLSKPTSTPSKKQSRPARSSETKLVTSITPFNFEGKGLVEFRTPRFVTPPDTPPYKILISGTTTPGTVVLLDEQQPIAVNERGEFSFTVELSKPEAIREFQAISPSGTVNNYMVNLDIPSKKEAPPEKSAPPQAQAFQEKPPSPDYAIPLKFDPVKNGVVIPTQSFEYAIFPTSDVKFGNNIIRSKTPSMRIFKTPKNQYVLKFEWPRLVMSHGLIEVRDPSEKVLWRKRVEAGESKKTKKSRKLSSPLDEILFFQLKIPKKDLNVFKPPTRFRFCMKSTEDGPKNSFCSVEYVLNETGSKIGLIPQIAQNEAMAVVDGKNSPRRGIVPFKDLKTRMHFRAFLPNGANFELYPGATEVRFTDILTDDSEQTVMIAGTGNPPEEFVGIATDGEWKAYFSKSNSSFYFVGQGGLPVRQDIQFTTPLPKINHRLWIKTNSPVSSYVSGLNIQGTMRGKHKITSQEHKAQNTGSNGFEWNFKLSERGRLNASQIKLTDKQQTYSAYYEAYKGFPFEISGRLTGILTTTGSIWLLWELAGGAWAESLFGWKNYWLSERRWGISAKYINSLKIASESPQLSTINLDLKYRFVPGLWNKDETVGAILGYQTMEYKTAPASMLGVGLLWARPMPEIFDDLFNIVPWFRFPKWVDMEGIYYLGSMDNKVKLGQGNYNVTFHGKMFFIPEFFMEASFGIKRFSYTNTAAQRRFDVTMFFGTGGLGYNF